MSNPASGDWEYYSTETTDSNGRISYVIPKNRVLTQGLYPVKMIVKYAYALRELSVKCFQGEISII